MASKKKPAPGNTAKTQAHPSDASGIVSPDHLKERFGPMQVPLASDFADFIDMADVGCRAAGQASDQDGTAGPGLMLSEGRLEVAAGDGLHLSDNQLNVLPNTAKGIAVNTDGIGINAGDGLLLEINQLKARPNAAKGVVVETAGIGINAGNGLLLETNQLKARPNAAKGVVVETAGIGINAGIGVELLSNQLRAKANSLKGLTVETAGIGLNTDAWEFILARALGVSLIATNADYMAFSGALYGGNTHVYVLPRGGRFPYSSAQYQAYVNGTGINATAVGLPSYRSGAPVDEKLVMLLSYPGTISAGSTISLPIMQPGGVRSASSSATFRSI